MTEHQGKEDRHNARMLRKKSIVDEKIAAAQVERGVLVINTGNGKGKSSSAFGVVARALGHDMKVAVIQFVKGRSDTGEEGFYRRMADSMPGSVRWHVTGEGFTWETQDSSRDAAAARAAWDLACAYLADSEINLVVLDEFTYALKYGWLDVAPVLAALAGRGNQSSVCLSGNSDPGDVTPTISTGRPSTMTF